MKVVEVASLTDYVGKELGASDWFQIDQDRINAFADATLDHQFIHVDETRAAQTSFGSTIAHGGWPPAPIRCPALVKSSPYTPTPVDRPPDDPPAAGSPRRARHVAG